MNGLAIKSIYERLADMLNDVLSFTIGPSKFILLVSKPNVNTTGFKGQRTEFKSLLYQTIQTRSTSGNGDAKPVGAQVGLGTRVAATTSTYTQGPLNSTERPTDFALEGDGFFAVRGTDNQTYYTRNGAFTWQKIL